MRDDDSIRTYAPLIRRIIILLAVIMAVPVVLWTITAFLRTYVAQPKVPTFQPMATAATVPAAPDSTSAAVTGPGKAADASPSASPAPAPLPSVAVANAATADTGGPIPQVPPQSVMSYSNNAAVSPAVAINAAPPPPVGLPSPPVPFDMADTGANSAPPVAAPSSPATDQVSDTQPITGPIPLPHPRPHFLAVASNAIPMPRTRPAVAADTDTAPASGGPLNWLGNIFRQGQNQPQQQ